MKLRYSIGPGASVLSYYKLNPLRMASGSWVALFFVHSRLMPPSMSHLLEKSQYKCFLAHAGALLGVKWYMSELTCWVDNKNLTCHLWPNICKYCAPGMSSVARKEQTQSRDSNLRLWWKPSNGLINKAPILQHSGLFVCFHCRSQEGCFWICWFAASLSTWSLL